MNRPHGLERAEMAEGVVPGGWGANCPHPGEKYATLVRPVPQDSLFCF